MQGWQNQIPKQNAYEREFVVLSSLKKIKTPVCFSLSCTQMRPNITA